MHVSFLISAIPILAIASNSATPAAVLTAYACLGALPHANMRWTYGKAGTIFVSPAYHRIHHAPTGRIDINLGTVFAIWDLLSGRAVFPAAGSARSARSTGPASPCAAAGSAAAVPPTGLAGRPIPVEHAGDRPRFVRTLFSQLAEPFSRNEV